jgi:hypothetical protein
MNCDVTLFTLIALTVTDETARVDAIDRVFTDKVEPVSVL